MDIEKGSGDAVSSTMSHQATNKLLTAASTFVSCIALAGMLVLLVQNQQTKADVKQLSVPKSVRFPDADQQEMALREVHDRVSEHFRSDRATATATSYACQYNRRNDYYKNCTNSPRKSNAVPSAHIVPDGSQHPCTIDNPSTLFYSIISVGWTCGAIHDRVMLPGYVRGGMIFDRDIGALVVPVEGVYFVYSQVHVNVSNPNQVLVTGTQTMICETERCRSTSYILSQALTDDTYGPFYHGGLFYLNANSTIKIAAWYDPTIGRRVDPHAESLAYTSHFTNTFFGAYLVEEVDPNAV